MASGKKISVKPWNLTFFSWWQSNPNIFVTWWPSQPDFFSWWQSQPHIYFTWWQSQPDFFFLVTVSPPHICYLVTVLAWLFFLVTVSTPHFFLLVFLGDSLTPTFFISYFTWWPSQPDLFFLGDSLTPTYLLPGDRPSLIFFLVTVSPQIFFIWFVIIKVPLQNNNVCCFVNVCHLHVHS